MSFTSALLPLDTAAEPSATRNASLTRLTAGTPRAPTTAEAASTSTLDASLVGVGGVVGVGGGGPCWDAMVTFRQLNGGVCQANCNAREITHKRKPCQKIQVIKLHHHHNLAGASSPAHLAPTKPTYIVSERGTVDSTDPSTTLCMRLPIPLSAPSSTSRPICQPCQAPHQLPRLLAVVALPRQLLRQRLQRHHLVARARQTRARQSPVNVDRHHGGDQLPCRMPSSRTYKWCVSECAVARLSLLRVVCCFCVYCSGDLVAFIVKIPSTLGRLQSTDEKDLAFIPVDDIKVMPPLHGRVSHCPVSSVTPVVSCWFTGEPETRSLCVEGKGVTLPP